MKKFIALTLAFSMLALILCSCGKAPANTETTVPEKIPKVTPTELSAAGDLLADFVAAAVDGKETDDKFVSSMLDFSVKLFKETLSKEKKHSLISPLSALIALGMVSNGSTAETRAQFETLFGMKIEDVNSYLYTLAKNLPNENGAKLELANSIWFSKDGGFEVNDDFLQTNKNYYDAQAYEENFFDKATVGKLNNWVKEHTDEMIDSIIDDIDPDTVMILVNALVFDSLWQEQYDEFSCKKGSFKAYDGTTSDVTMMHSTEGVYLKAKGVRGFTKNYQNGYKFVGLLPDGDVFDFIASLDGDKLAEIFGSAKYAEVVTTLPQFEYDYSISMNKALCDMGISDAFSPSKADFSRLGRSNGGNIYIGDVLHKTYIEMTAAGTRAAAVTAIVCKATSVGPKPKYTVSLDKPFVYLIVDSANNIPIFMGVVTDIK